MVATSVSVWLTSLALCFINSTSASVLYNIILYLLLRIAIHEKIQPYTINYSAQTSRPLFASMKFCKDPCLALLDLSMCIDFLVTWL
jgi:hypothetical protein